MTSPSYRSNSACRPRDRKPTADPLADLFPAALVAAREPGATIKNVAKVAGFGCWQELRYVLNRGVLDSAPAGWAEFAAAMPELGLSRPTTENTP
jgi:hypothetical protein